MSSKRKADIVQDPTEIYKSARLEGSGTENSSHKTSGSQDHATNDHDPETITAGSALEDEDEEGRFFGGGITDQEAQILDYVDQFDSNGTGDVESGGKTTVADTIDVTWLRKTVQSLEKLISKNAEQRAKYIEEPQKFMDSETELDTEIKNLSLLSEAPELYQEFVRIGGCGSFVGLLAHENTDIAIDTLEIISELIDDEVSATDEQWNVLAKAMIEDSDLINLLSSNLARLRDPTDEGDQLGIHATLSIIESICSRPEFGKAIVRETGLIQWLSWRIQQLDSPLAGISQNQQYAAEVLAILVQSSAAVRKSLLTFHEDHGEPVGIMEQTLQLIAAYQGKLKVDDAIEEEYLANLFETLNSLVQDHERGKPQFVSLEGVELCLILLQSGNKKLREPSLRLLERAVLWPGIACVDVSIRIVDASGLKPLFSLFMKQKRPGTITGLLLSIFASMLLFLPADSPQRIRTLAKFVEKNYEKLNRLLLLRRQHLDKLEPVKKSWGSLLPNGYITRLKGEDDENYKHRYADFLEHYMDKGGYWLESIDLILSWLIAEDSGAKKVIAESASLPLIATSLRIRLHVLEDEESQSDLIEAIQALTSFLE